MICGQVFVALKIFQAELSYHLKYFSFYPISLCFRSDALHIFIATYL